MDTPSVTDAVTSSDDEVRTDEPVEAPSRTRSRLPGILWPVGLFLITLALSYWYYHRAWVHPMDSWIGGQGDPEQQMWFMRWPIYALMHANNPLYTDYLLYPSGTNLMWNGSDITPGLLIWPVTVIWGPVLSYNVLMLLAPPASALAAYAAFRRWSNRLGAAAGALLFAFCPFVIAHSSGHLHLVLIALLPLSLLLLDEILVRQSWPWWVSGGLFGLLCVAQLLTSEEILAIMCLLAAAGVVILVLLHRSQVRDKLAYVWRAAAAAVGVFVVLAAYPLYIQFLGSNQVKETIHSNNVYVTDLLNVVIPVNQRVRPHWVLKYIFRFTGNGSEWTGYIGVPLLVILIVLLIARWRRPIVLYSAIMGTIALLFSLGPWLHIGGHQYRILMPWAPFTKMPVLHQLIPGRFSIVVTLFVALGLALAITEVARSRHLWARGAAVVGVGLVALFWLPGALPLTRVPTPSYFTSSAVNQIPAGSVALVLPYVSGAKEQHAMLWQAQAGMRFRMIDGWAIIPGNHAGPMTQTRITFSSLTPETARIPDATAAQIRTELGSQHVQTILVGPYLNGDPRRQQSAVKVVTQIVGRPPVQQGGVAAWYGLQF
jgi:hypothetical protein